MNKGIKGAFISLNLLLCSLLAAAQDNDNKDKSFNESFDFVQTYKPKITDAIKLSISPAFEKIEYKKDSVSYNAEVIPLLLDLKSTSKIGTVSLVKPKTKSEGSELERIFLKAGIGNYSNIFAQVDYNSTKLENSSYAVHFTHQSGNAAPDNSNFYEQNFYVAGRNYFKNKLLEGKIFLDNNSFHYYGYNHDSTPELANFITQQKFLNVGFNAHFNNELDTSGKVKYWFDLDFSNLSDAFELSENEFKLSGVLEQNINNYPIRFNLSYLSFNEKIKNIVEKKYLVHIGVNYLVTKENWRTELGFLIDYDSDTSITNNMHFYPNIYAQARLHSNTLIVFAGMTGNVITNSFKSLSEENPYILEEPKIRNTNNKYEVYGGFKGNFSKDLNYLAKISYRNIEYMSMFVNNNSVIDGDSSTLNRFDVVYDSLTTTLMTFHAELSKFINEKFEIFLGFNYYKYTMSHEDYPWHKPGYDLKLSLKYKLEKKIFLGFDLINIGERKAKNFTDPNTPVILDPIYDANIGITYQFNKMIGIYFQFNNILSNKYSYWYNYELRGFQAVGGLKVNL